MALIISYIGIYLSMKHKLVIFNKNWETGKEKRGESSVMGLRPSVSPPKQTRTQQQKNNNFVGEREREKGKRKARRNERRVSIRFLYSIVTRLEMENWKPVSVVCLLIWLRTGRGQATEWKNGWKKGGKRASTRQASCCALVVVDSVGLVRGSHDSHHLA